ncbi:MAG: hypothetical protein U7123_12225 [Potamolinea sp.]
MTTNRSNEFLTISETVQRFEYILNAAPRHSTVRQSVIIGIYNQFSRAVQRDVNQARQNLQEIAQNLRPLLKKLTRKELDIIVTIVTIIYLRQRQYLEGGDAQFEIKRIRYPILVRKADELEDGENKFGLEEIRYPIWVRGTRPLTTIEEIILEWLGNTRYPIAQQLAMQVKVEFAKVLDQAEEKYIQNILGQHGITELELDRPLTGQLRSFFLYPIVGRLATIGRRSYRPVVGTVLPEAFHQDISSPDSVDFVLSKWKDNENDIPGTDLTIATTSHRLGLGLTLAKKPWLWMIPSSLAIVAVPLVAKGIGESFISNIPCCKFTPEIGPPKEPEKGIVVLPNANIKDMRSTDFDMGKITVEFSNGATVDDRVWIHHQGKNQGQIGIDGNNVTYGGEVIGKVEGGDGTKPLVATLNNKSTPDAATALLRNIEYANVSPKILTGTRELTFKVGGDKENITSKSFTKKINLTTENQAPVVKLPGNKIVQKCSDLIIGAISISDIDSQIITVTLRVNNGILKIQSTENKSTNNVPSKPKFVNRLKIEGNKTKTIVLTGKIASIKTALANPNAIIYHSDKDFSGEDSLSVTVNDNGKIIPSFTDKSLVYPENALKAKTVENQKINITVTPF